MNDVATVTRARVPSPSDFTPAPANGVPAVVVDAPKLQPQALAVVDRPPPQIFEAKGVVSIAGAITAVMNEIGVVGKDGRNEFHKYNYAKMEDILQHLTPLLGKHGLIVIQTEIGRAMFDNDNAVAVQYQFTIAHKSGDVWPERVLQTGLSRCRNSKDGFDDKALNKCHTAARKYFLLALFQIPTGDIDEADQGTPARERTNGAPSTRRPVPSPTGRTPPYVISTDGEKFETWTDKYIAAISKAATLEELNEWDKLNTAPLDEMHRKNPALYGKIETAFEQRKNDLAAREPEPRKEPEQKRDPRDPGPIPEALRRTAPGDMNADKEWLNDVEGAFSSCTTLGELGQKQQEVMAPKKGAVSSEAWARAQGHAEDAFKRIQAEG